MILCKLGVSLLGDVLTGKAVARDDRRTITAGERTIRADQNF